MQIELPELYDPNTLLSSAVQNFIDTAKEQYIQVWLNGLKEDPYLASYFLRTEIDLPELESIALSICKGQVLDIGAGAGAHSQVLSKKDLSITALEKDSGFCKILSKIDNITIEQQDFFSWETEKSFDTILLLMNGFGIAQSEKRLPLMINRLKNLLLPNGRILAELTDYRFSPEYDHSIMSQPQVTFRLMYEGKFSSEYQWLYPNIELIEKHCNAEQMNINLLYQEDETLLLEITK